MDDELRTSVKILVEQCLDESSRRDTYIEGLVSSAKGAMGEYFKARYAEANVTQRKKGVRGTAQGWDREARSLLHFGFRASASRRLKSGGQKGTFNEALEDLRAMVPAYLDHARDHVAAAFGVNPRQMVDPTDAATDEFFALVENEFEAIWK